jgi:antirestriction protein
MEAIQTQTESIKAIIDRHAPSVYVGTYAKYNSGSIQGAWVRLDQFANEDEFLTYCTELHKDEEDPEFMYQDFENFPEEYYSESGINPDLWDYLALDDDDRAMFEAYKEAGLEGSFSDAQDAYSGQFEDDYSFAWDMLENSGDLSLIPEHLQVYFDVDKFARDLMYDYSEANGYYFLNC